MHFPLGTVTLPISSTKNDEPSAYPFGGFPELPALSEARREETERLQRERGILIPWVFFRIEKQAVRPIAAFHAKQVGVSRTEYGTVSAFPVPKKEQHGEAVDRSWCPEGGSNSHSVARTGF